MKRLLFVIHTLQVGGAERILLNLLKNIDKEKYSITVLAIVNDGVYVEELRKIKGIQYKYLFNAYFKKTRENEESKYNIIAKKIMNFIWKIYIELIKYFPKKLYKKAIKEKYDVEIAFLEGKVSKLVAYSTNKQSKKIAWIHTDINNKHGIDAFKSINEEEKCYKKFNKIVCVSEEVKNIFTKKTGIKNNLYVQMNPIDSEEILGKSKEKIKEKLNNKGLIICSVGRLVKEKGYDRLLEIHKKLIDESIIHTLWIVGEGEERKKLELYIKKHRLEKTVNLIGYTDNPYKYVKNADIFVSSSRIEGLSSALLEATILEKIIVTTNCPGTKDILGENGQVAVIVDNNTKDLYKGIKQVLTDIKLQKKLSENIKIRSKKFNIESSILEIEKLIDE